MLKKFRNPVSQTAAVFLVSLLVLALAWQVPFTFSINLGTPDDDWAVLRGFSDRESNGRFNFRWTMDQEAELRLPDVGWPSRIGLVGVAPRPNASPPAAFLATASSRTQFGFDPSAASRPADELGRLTFQAAGPAPRFSLRPNSLWLGSELFQPQGDNRLLGVVVSQVYLQPQPSRFGLVIPPLAAWLGWGLVISLIYVNLIAFPQRAPVPVQGRSPLVKTYLPIAASGSALVLIVALQLSVPQWLAVNGASIAWGIALPLAVWVGLAKWPLKWQAASLGAVVIGSILLVYWERALGPFALTTSLAAGLLLLTSSLRSNFASHWQNVVLIISLSAGAGWGLWQGRLPRTEDTERHHLFWVSELDRLIQQGNFYPRWSPIFSWERGGPIFQYYPPLSRYLIESFHLLGMTFNNGLMLLQYGALVFGAVGCYFWTFELLRDRRAALLGGLAFSYFPFHFAEFYSVGSIANQLAGAFLPWIFWQLTLLFRQSDKSFNPLWLGLLGGALALTNNPQLIVFVFSGSLYMAGLAVIERKTLRRNWWPIGWRLGVAGAVAFGLSAFFLLPATLESKQVGLLTAGSSLEPNSYLWANRDTYGMVWRKLEPQIHYLNHFGTLHYWLAGLGFVRLLFQKSLHRVQLIWLALLVGLLLLLQDAISRPFWETFSLIRTIQYSSRLLNPLIVFLIPLLAGLALVIKPDKRQWRWLNSGVVLVVCGLILYACLHKVDTAYWRPTFTGAISQRALTEQYSSADVLYMPKGLTNIKMAENYRPPVFNDNRTTGLGDRLDWKITGPDSYRLEAVVSRPASVTVTLFWFEGWWKVTDGQGRTYETTPAPETFLTMLNLPPGEHQITVKLQDTPVRLVSNALSLVTVVALLVFFAYRKLVRPRLDRVRRTEKIGSAEPQAQDELSDSVVKY